MGLDRQRVFGPGLESEGQAFAALVQTREAWCPVGDGAFLVAIYTAEKNPGNNSYQKVRVSRQGTGPGDAKMHPTV